jgi:hypothetical protein
MALTNSSALSLLRRWLKARHNTRSMPSAASSSTCRAGGPGGPARFRGEVLARLRLEDHHAAGQAQGLAALAQPRQDSLVTTVNTVEVANSGDTAPMLGAQVVETSNQLHNALLAHKVADYNHTRALTTGSSVGKVWNAKNRRLTRANLSARPCD